MNLRKRKLLNETYEKFMKVSMNKLPAEILDGIAAENIMAYGTTLDEKLLSIQDCRDLVERQLAQATGMKFKHERIPETIIISPEEDSAIFVEELKLAIKSNKDTHRLFLRITTALEYSDNKWKVVHFHTSKPDDTKGETDTWHIDEWKRKNEELQKLVDEKTTDLVIKNRDLEIEASLERVRAIAMGMRKSEDLLNICEILFNELNILGFEELRNTMINIHNDEEETFLNYDYSDTLGKTITPLFYNINPIIAKQIKQIRKGRDAFSETSFKGDELKEWKKFRKRKGEPDDPRLKNTKALYYYFYSIGTGSIGISTFNSISKEKLVLLKRFRNVFEFAYRRYMDVTQAEAQAREAKIEAALERVRSRTLAMQKSDELSETTFVLFKQFMELDEAPDQITIGIINKEEKVIEFWTTMEGNKVDQMVKFPIKETNLMRKIHTAWKKQKKSIALEINGKELHDYIDYRIRLTGVKTKADHVYERRFIQAAFFSKGIITISTNEPRSKETLQLLERFAGVFDLTYTRFLDLKQAEAQTKEARIELSLERVRARSMAMHHSSELVDSSVVLFNELKSLGIEAIRTGVAIVNESDKSLELWSSQLIENERNKILGVVPFKSHPFFEAYYKSWKKKATYFFNEISGKEVRKYYKTMSSILSYPEKKLFNPRELFYTFFFPEGSLNVVSKNNLSEDECNLMIRFAKTFGIIYRRFLDLQKAEEQAREAQIELALERVRARTMAMQRSDELEDTSKILFQQFKELGEHPERITIGTINEDERQIELWVTVEGDKNRKVNVSIDETSVFKNIYLAWKDQKKSILIDLTGKQLSDYLAYRSSFGNTHGKSDFLKDRMIAYVAFFSKGIISISTPELRPRESIQLLERFAGVFDLTYTRFLDLQKAEEQAREAQIETALERVRSRTMGMQKSEELGEVSRVMNEQLQQLNFKNYIAGFIMDYKNSDDFEIWRSDPSQLLMSKTHIPYFDHPIFKEFIRAKEKCLDFNTLSLTFEEKNKWVDYVLPYFPALPQEIIDALFSGAGYATSVAFMKNVGVYIENFDGIPFSEDENAILIRFGKVFEQTYTRFLDLQKAESQAREAQIEVALERVRSRTMAMHKSEELAETAAVLFEQLCGLGIDALRLYIGIIDHKNDEIDFWTTDYGGSQISSKYKASLLGSATFRKIYSGWKEKRKSLVVDPKGKELTEHLYYLKEIMSYPIRDRKTLSRRLQTIAYFSKGLIGVLSADELPKESVILLERFAGVFDLTYRRFLDLQKAEDQTREAQIEVALERVRSRTMAMHSSEELQDAAVLLFQQIRDLGVNTGSCGYIIWDKEEKGATAWMSSAEGGNQQSFKLPHTKSKIYKEIYSAKESGKDLFVKEVKGAELKKHFDYLTTLPGIGEKIKQLRKARYKFPETIVYNTAFFKQGYLSFHTHEHSPEAQDIFRRFANVFEQTYTRFLDLQKAEAQTREAQIQLALERVRAKAMAMQKSDELLEVSLELYNQFKQLDSSVRGLTINIVNEMERVFEVSFGMFNQSFKLSIDERIVMSKAYKCWKSGKKSLMLELARKDLIKFNKIRNTAVGSEIFPLEYKSGFKLIMYMAFFSNGMLIVGMEERKPEETTDILQRFASVFDLTYTRFLDLKKAEAQAREARIEAALEKVRSRSLAMHNAEELGEVITVVVEKLRELNFSVDDGVALITHIEGSKDLLEWMANPGFPSAIKFYLPYFEHPVLSNLWKAKNEGAEFFALRYTAKENKSFLNHIFKHSDFKHTPQPIKDYCLAANTYATSIAFQKNTAIFINDYSGKTLTYQEIDILKRFSKVFEQAYIRFLDLQKAEAQAREAQIEASLERVRSRTMGMQKSEELKDVIQVIYEQFVHLNINIDHAGIIMDYKEREDMNIWVSDHRGAISQVTIPYFDTEHWNRFNEAKEKGKDFFAVNLSFKEKNIFYKKLFKFIPELPEEAKAFYFTCPGLAISTVLLDNVSLYIENFSGVSYSDEENATLMRFGKVFQQTYTRFLDLQKAEAQAREAQIQLALERVRARAMAMQKSDELSELVDTVFKELTKLDFALTWCIINIIDEGSMSNTVWAANPDINKPPESYHMLFEDYPFHHAMMKGWKERKAKCVHTIEGSEKKIYDDYLFSETEFKRIPEAAQAASRAMEKYVVSFSFSNFGGLQTVGDAPLSDANLDILSRFGKVFDLTYTRFNDLKQTEAQARESKIEAALERVRSQTMGMQTSEDLSKVAAAMFDQIRLLGGELFSCGIVLCDENKNEVDQWLSAPDIGMMPPFFVPKNLDFIHQYRYDQWKAGAELFSIEIPENKIAQHFELLFALPSLKNILDSITAQGLSLPEVPRWEIDYGASFKYGYILISALQPFNEAHIFPRFAKVFEQTYTRFLDLQKAEAQAREAQIEAALERVRGKAMAMHNSDDLTEAAGQVFTELNNLGIKPIRSGFVLLTPESRKAKLYPATSFDNKNTISFTGEVEFTGHPVYEKQYEIWQKNENYFPVLEGDLLKSYYKILAEGLSVPYENFPTDKKQFGTFLPFSEGFLFTWSDETYSGNEINILDRFKNILDLTIRRYIDLKNAEAQSRESQIEASLERVRSKAMAMQTSDDLASAVATIFEELDKLDLGTLRCGIGIIKKENKSVDVWATSIAENETVVQISGDESMDKHPLLQGAFDAWLRQEDFSYLLQGEDLINYYISQTQSNFKLPDSQSILTEEELLQQYYYVATFQSGGLFAFRDSEFPEEAKIVIKRFADVINFTYTRFNDLKQAEGQAKEAKIEAALERVRASSLIMRKPEDMFDVCKVISEQLILLNVNDIRNTQTVILNEGKETYRNYEYFPDYNEKTFSEIDYNLHPKVTEFVSEIKKSSEAFFTTSFEGKDLQEWRDYRKNTNQIPDAKLDAATSVHYYFYSIGPGALGISTYATLSEEQISIFKRFRNVFELAYRRYIDIEQAEAQAREAQIEASLERVRSRTLAMQKSDELAETAAVVFKQLINLGIEPNRLYIGIINDDSGDIEAWATDEDGSKVSKEFTLNINSNGSVKKMYDGWAEKNSSIIIDMQGKELEEYLHYISDVLHVPFKGGLSQDRRVQNIAYFSKGFIGMASPDPQPEETAVLLERFAAVFNLTFTRFNDLQIAEKHAEQAELDLIKLQTEKKRAEEALAELRSTQAQLIQSEKMASLGELTAGIAHEIQNPLNFVNNFSEVNTELVDELNHELDKGNFEEAVLIAKDIKENEEKIKHHGKRAEAIVKGMLQHSRSSSGVKEPTNINSLADEYLRLAYHGLRAKDKTFNAKMETDFDESIGEISVVPQDIGRVILNLITNAFYAVTEKKKEEIEGYEPAVTVITKKSGDKVLISVKDNGNGIPQKVMDKIFQPFFTTKPTGQGTGLGLSMSYDIVKAHGGELKVETKENDGTIFTIYLPAK